MGPKSNPIEILPMAESHLDQVHAIEKEAFARPMNKAGFLREMTLPMAKLMVAQRGKRVMGYMNYWQIDHEIHILNIAVRKKYRREGIGQKLFESMLEKTKAAKSYHLELRVSNTPAQHFYESFGFSIAGKRKGYYQDNQEDALLMSWVRA